MMARQLLMLVDDQTISLTVCIVIRLAVSLATTCSTSVERVVKSILLYLVVGSKPQTIG